MPDGHQTPRAQQMPQNMELVKFFRDEVGMEQEDAAFCSDVCEENYGVKEAHDLKYLTDKDMRKIVSKCRLLKAPAGKLMDTWKGLVGITEGPDHVPELSDATYIDHARKLLTQICKPAPFFLSDSVILSVSDTTNWFAFQFDKRLPPEYVWYVISVFQFLIHRSVTFAAWFLLSRTSSCHS